MDAIAPWDWPRLARAAPIGVWEQPCAPRQQQMRSEWPPLRFASPAVRNAHPSRRAGADYTVRAVVKLEGLTANTAQQAVHYGSAIDNAGQLLTGAKTYTLTFAGDTSYLTRRAGGSDSAGRGGVPQLDGQSAQAGQLTAFNSEAPGLIGRRLVRAGTTRRARSSMLRRDVATPSMATSEEAAAK